MLKGVKSVHFIGIGGIGMSGLARLLLKKGYLISGSDQRKNVFTEELEKRGATIYQGHSASYLAQPDLVVVSSAISSHNPELQKAKKKGISIVSRGALLAHLVNKKEGIIIAGTHGKTTTSCLVWSILRSAGEDSTILIGGEVNAFGGNSKLGQSRYVVAESDESDGSFLLLSPKISVLTNLEDDHLDYYGSEKRLGEAFIKFAMKLKPGGILIINTDDLHLNEVLRSISLSSSQKLTTYGIDRRADLSASKIKLQQLCSFYEVNYRGEKMGNVNLPLPGKHNIYNSLASIAVGLNMGIKWEKISKALFLFPGVRRRFQLVGKKSDILIVDDYAHHPTEIRATLKTATRLQRRTIAIFQPHRYTRTKMFLSKFASAFEKADILILTDIYAAGENPIPGVDGRLLFEEAKRKRKKKTYYFSTFQEIIDFLKVECRKGDLILTLGAGDINEAGRSFLKRAG